VTGPFRDPSLAAERTQLAWQRYTLGLATAAALCLRSGIVGRHTLVGFALAGILGALAALLQIAGPGLSPRTAAWLVTAASLIAAGGALLLGLL
jgi:hypothetical protein